MNKIFKQLYLTFLILYQKSQYNSFYLGATLKFDHTHVICFVNLYCDQHESNHVLLMDVVVPSLPFIYYYLLIYYLILYIILYYLI